MGGGGRADLACANFECGRRLAGQHSDRVLVLRSRDVRFSGLGFCARKLGLRQSDVGLSTRRRRCSRLIVSCRFL